MKTFINYFLGMFAVVSLSSCANGKKLQEEAPVAFLQAYYTIHLAQDDSDAHRMNLFIPTDSSVSEEIQLDSVYFRSRKAELVNAADQPGQFVAYFEMPGRDKDFVMDIDPKKEYGNTVPVLEKIPFDLKSDEAVVVYRKNGKTEYYKLEGIKEKGSNQEK